MDSDYNSLPMPNEKTKRSDVALRMRCGSLRKSLPALAGLRRTCFLLSCHSLILMHSFALRSAWLRRFLRVSVCFSRPYAVADIFTYFLWGAGIQKEARTERSGR